MKTINNQTGASLIEILVALMVVSIGLLGVARLEIFSAQANIEAIQRTTASMIAHDFMEKMRANPGTLASYVGISAGDGNTSVPSNACNSANCNAADIAAWDIYNFDQSLAGANEQAGANNTGGLDSPRACVNGPAGGPGVYSVHIAWRGLQPQPNPVTTQCGEGLGLYGPQEEYRRVLTMTIFISDDGVN